MQVVEISETHLQEMIVKEDVGPVYPWLREVSFTLPCYESAKGVQRLLLDGVF